jgi:AAHS family 4-hydroxybenzoate transporter-like MFS transporter
MAGARKKHAPGEEGMAQDRTLDVGNLIEGRSLGRPQIAIALWLCFLMVLEGYDMQTLSFAAPAILREWQVSRADFGLVLSAHLFGYMVGALILSVFGDRLGRKNIIVAGATIFGAFTFAGGFATSPTEMFLLRAGAGFGLGGSIPTGIALAAEYMPKRVRATTIGLMFVGYNIGAAIGGFVASWTIEDFGWSYVFYIGGLGAVPMFLGLAYALPESIRFLVVRGAPLAQVTALARRIRPEDDFSAVSRFVVTEEVQKSSPANLFTENRGLVTLLLWFSFIASFLGHYFLTAWMPTVLSDEGLTIEQAAFAGGMFQVGGALGSFFIAYFLDKGGIRVVAITFLLAAPIVATIGLESAYAALLGIEVLAGFTVLGGQIGLNALSGTIYPTFIRATGAGYAFGVGRIGSITAPIAGGYLIALGFSRTSLFFMAGIPFIFCALALYGMYNAKRTQDRLDGAAMPAAAKAH